MSTSITITAIIAALALIGMMAVTLVTIPLQVQQQAYAAPAQTFTIVREIPFDETIFVPCAAGGAGEEVHLTGTAHVIFHVTLDGAGGAHVKTQGNFQGVSGTGLTTGDKYQASDAINTEVNVKVGAESTNEVTANFIGRGNAPNFQLHELFHVTINADGTATAFVNDERVECK
jgi:hypothetical protein